MQYDRIFFKFIKGCPLKNQGCQLFNILKLLIHFGKVRQTCLFCLLMSKFKIIKPVNICLVNQPRKLFIPKHLAICLQLLLHMTAYILVQQIILLDRNISVKCRKVVKIKLCNLCAKVTYYKHTLITKSSQLLRRKSTTWRILDINLIFSISSAVDGSTHA